jgi:steroid delta-isomerase-like uncharacterized protein
MAFALPSGLIRQGGLVAAVVLIISAFGQSLPAKTDDSKLLQDLVAAWNSHNSDAVAALFADDAVYVDYPLGLSVTGREQIRAVARGFFDAVPDLRLEWVNGSLKGGNGTLEYFFSGTDVGVFGTGKRFAFYGVLVLDTHGTEITGNRDYYDLATIMQQLGIL